MRRILKIHLSKLCSLVLARWQGPLQASANTVMQSHAAWVCNIWMLRAKCLTSAFKQMTNTISYSEDKAKWTWGFPGFRCGHVLIFSHPPGPAQPGSRTPQPLCLQPLSVCPGTLRRTCAQLATRDTQPESFLMVDTGARGPRTALSPHPPPPHQLHKLN